MSDKLIAAIRVDKLFGLYTYRLPEKGSFSDATILYGDNGVGKSTILRLAFHLLSAANNRSHRTALLGAHFQSLEVELASGVVLKAHFPKGQNEERILTLEIIKQDKILAIWNHQSKEARRKLAEGEDFVVEHTTEGSRIIMRSTHTKKQPGSIPQGERAYLTVLEKHVPAMFILNADRQLDSDLVADPSDEVELRRVMHYEEPRKINEIVGRSREIALSQAINSANTWVGKKAVLGANKGSMNVHSVYVDVLHHLVSPTVPQPEATTQPDIASLLKQLNAIEIKTTALSKYELATQLSISEFKKALSARAKTKSKLAAELLMPYIKSLERRLEAVEPIYQIVDRFVTIVNGLLRDKTLSFKLS